METADAILRNGFPETDGFYGPDQTLVGVWLADRPLNANDGVIGDGILSVTFNVDLSELAFYELVDPGKSYRQWCLPASLIKARATVDIVPFEKVERFWYLTDVQYLQSIFASAHKTHLDLQKAVAAVKDSKELLMRVEGLLNRQLVR